MSQNYLLRLAFNGAAYHGFQVQANAPTVCAAVQNTMQAVLGVRPDVKGCSRTDAGVHARGFALSFKHDTAIPPEKLPLALNSRLPHDIRVLSAQRVGPDFHARYSARGKRYCYYILNRAVDDPFTDGQYYRIPHTLDVAAMNAAAAHLVGKHDFAAFAAATGGADGASGEGPGGKGTVRTLTRLCAERAGEVVVITAEGDGFLYHMVRILAGTLAEAGLGRLPLADVPAILRGRSRAAAGPTLPARGLFLERVVYRDEDLL